MQANVAPLIKNKKTQEIKLVFDNCWTTFNTALCFWLEILPEYSQNR